ncbi:MAG TPA: hypothetical protein VK251_09755 [Steroidobacteraceae bacterium]|nr:hypothetical protein [Steroidobacteraceae bacterium]
MRKLLKSPATLCTLVVGFALPLAANSAEPASGPCEQIAAACSSAGFVKGDYRQGYGLWRDCIDPIMRGTAQPANADKPLPAVNPELIAACKQKHPNFGEGKKAAPPPPANTPPKGT